jgi:hypothetical protein
MCLQGLAKPTCTAIRMLYKSTGWRSMLTSQPSVVVLCIQAMGYPQFVDAAAMTGLLLFGLTSTRPPYPGAPPVRPNTLEDQLDLFFSHLCGLKHSKQGSHAGAGGTKKSGSPKRGQGGAGGNQKAVFGNSVGRDPYKEWWDLAGPEGQGFKESAANMKAWAPNSSLALKPILIQVRGLVDSLKAPSVCFQPLHYVCVAIRTQCPQMPRCSLVQLTRSSACCPPMCFVLFTKQLTGGCVPSSLT